MSVARGDRSALTKGSCRLPPDEAKGSFGRFDFRIGWLIFFLPLRGDRPPCSGELIKSSKRVLVSVVVAPGEVMSREDPKLRRLVGVLLGLLLR